MDNRPMTVGQCKSGAALRRAYLTMLTSVPQAQHNLLNIKIHIFFPLLHRQARPTQTFPCVSSHSAANSWFSINFSYLDQSSKM